MKNLVIWSLESQWQCIRGRIKNIQKLGSWNRAVLSYSKTTKEMLLSYLQLIYGYWRLQFFFFSNTVWKESVVILQFLIFSHKISEICMSKFFAVLKIGKLDNPDKSGQLADMNFLTSIWTNFVPHCHHISAVFCSPLTWTCTV